MTNCSECDLFPRAPGLRVCSACWDVAQEKAHGELARRLHDPDQPPPLCMDCKRPETPDEEIPALVARGEEIVSFCVLLLRKGSTEQGWLCSGCYFTDDGEDWKRGHVG